MAERAAGFLSQNQAAVAEKVQGAVQQVVTTKALEAMAAFPREVVESLGPADLLRITNNIRTNAPEYRALLSATAQAKAAEAKGQLTTALQNQVAQAQKKLAKAIAREIEKTLPSSVEGNQWWVDPIIGLRAQVNLTRWLFIALQGDVGGFGAGSNIAWNAQGSVGVNFTRNIFAETGWRYFYMDYARNGALYRAAEFGLFSGIGIKF